MSQSIDLVRASSQNITIADHALLDALDGSSTLTIEYWVKHDINPDTTEQDPTSRGIAGVDGQWEIRHNSGIHFYVNNGANFKELHTTNIDGSWATATWYHIACVFNNAAGSKLIAYLNGVNDSGTLVESGAMTALATSSKTIYVGSRESGNYVDGHIFDFRVWSTARTQDEINANRLIELNGDEAGLVTNILFDGNTINKVSGGTDGVLVNSPAYETDVPAGYTFQESGIFYPSTNQGFLEYFNPSWATTRNAATGSTADDDNESKVGAWDLGGSNFVIDRAYFPIDTSGIPDSAVITSASLWIYQSTADRDFGGHEMVIVQTADLGVITTADYDQIGSVDSPTKGGSAAPSGASGWHEIPLNETGRGWIDKEGFTYLGLRGDLDTDDTTPSENVDELFIAFNNVDAVSNKPYLQVEYTIPYDYSASITIDNTKVAGSSDLTDFPVLVSGTYDGTGSEPDLRSVANGGNIQNLDALGGVGGALEVPADLAFFSDEELTTQLDHEFQSYDAATGAISAWVRVPTLLYNSDTTIYLGYSDTSVFTSQENINAVWASYLAVWHLEESGDGTANEYKDSTSNVNHGQGGSGTGSAVPTQASGWGIDNHQDFDGGDHIGGIGDVSTFDSKTELSVQAWVQPDNISNNWNIMDNLTRGVGGGNDGGFRFYIADPANGYPYFFVTDADDNDYVERGLT
ncbi:MAG: DUF2341 domain-containing protein, partial [Alphaproteobacteria bacterium]|nr:DUF2341 domain-containing protein [Alphaproteobacteria bacterium]